MDAVWLDEFGSIAIGSIAMLPCWLWMAVRSRYQKAWGTFGLLGPTWVELAQTLTVFSSQGVGGSSTVVAKSWTQKKCSFVKRRFYKDNADERKTDQTSSCLVASIEIASRKGPIFSFGLSGRDPVGKQKIPGPGAYELAQDLGRGARANVTYTICWKFESISAGSELSSLPEINLRNLT